MRLLLISNAYAPEPAGIGPYSAGLAEHLAAQGHEVEVVCANPSFPHWRLYPGYRAWKWSVAVERGVTVHRCPLYLPRHISALRRVLHYLTFALAALGPVVRLCLRRPPDVVLCVAPTLLAAPVALLGARVARARTWLHVQDFEVDAATGVGQMRADSLATRLALRFERACIAAFDIASSISPEMCRRLVTKGAREADVVEFRNWAELDPDTPLEQSPYRGEWGVAEPQIALYSGTIGRKQGIEIVAEAARALRHRTDLRFLICGNGPGRDALATAAADLPNLTFHDLQPRERLRDLLALATIHLLPQRAGAADAVLPSKLTNMLASGRPSVVAASPGTGLFREADGCGVLVPPEDAAAFAAAVEKLADDGALADHLANAARARARTVWSKSAILGAIEKRLATLAARSGRALRGA